MSTVARRVSFLFLCAAPFIVMAAVTQRPLRIAGAHTAVGAVLFAAIASAAWILGLRALRADASGERRLALPGAFLAAPFAIVALLWVGIATPWEATPNENVLRYLVLLADSVAIAMGFFILADLLGQAGERFYSTLGGAANLLGGASFVVWTTFQVGFWAAKVRTGEMPSGVAAVDNGLDVLLFAAGALTYLASAAFAASLARAGWLGRGASRVYVLLNLLLLVFLIVRGVSFPNPAATSTPWYLQPGFIAGIPAVPWVMPFLLGVVMLRRAGNERA